MTNNDPSIYGTCAKCQKQFPHEDLEGVDVGIWFVRVCESCKKKLDPEGNAEQAHVVSIANTGEGPENEGHDKADSGPENGKTLDSRQLKLF